MLRQGVIDRLVRLALKEDIGLRDVTTESLFKKACEPLRAVIIAKEPFILAGVYLAQRVFQILDNEIKVRKVHDDGDSVEQGEVLLEVEGDVRALLSGERVALNFLQRLSGIATLTRRFVDKVRDYPVKILDTRKTTPLLRYLERYAVRVGGGYSHRFGLYDGILIKDNHIKACGGIKEALKRVKDNAPIGLKVEVEVNSLDELKSALDLSPDIILLDNMEVEAISKAVEMAKGRVLFEVSGGVNLENVEAIARTGVDFISIGALTHSARAVDISMEIV